MVNVTNVFTQPGSFYKRCANISNNANVSCTHEVDAQVLKPGGRFLCMEFSRMNSPILQQVYDFYSFAIIP